MEAYFRASRTAEDVRVDTAVMFLSDDAKLWWRTCCLDDQQAGRVPITTWEELRKELRDQFLPHNTSWCAREKIKELRQTGSMHKYVRVFNSLMLEIHNMSEEDKFFNFMLRPQTWAQAELLRMDVRDLPSAIVKAEGLVDRDLSHRLRARRRKRTVTRRRRQPHIEGIVGRMPWKHKPRPNGHQERGVSYVADLTG